MHINVSLLFEISKDSLLISKRVNYNIIEELEEEIEMVEELKKEGEVFKHAIPIERIQ
jgi:hypothetical protein